MTEGVVNLICFGICAWFAWKDRIKYPLLSLGFTTVGVWALLVAIATFSERINR